MGFILAFFNGISTFMGYLMPEPSLEKHSSGTNLPIDGRIKDFHTFRKGISLKVNIITRLEFDLVYYDSAVQHVNHNVTDTSPS